MASPGTEAAFSAEAIADIDRVDLSSSACAGPNTARGTKLGSRQAWGSHVFRGKRLRKICATGHLFFSGLYTKAPYAPSQDAGGVISIQVSPPPRGFSTPNHFPGPQVLVQAHLGNCLASPLASLRCTHHLRGRTASGWGRTSSKSLSLKLVRMLRCDSFPGHESRPRSILGYPCRARFDIDGVPRQAGKYLAPVESSRDLGSSWPISYALVRSLPWTTSPGYLNCQEYRSSWLSGSRLKVVELGCRLLPERGIERAATSLLLPASSPSAYVSL